MMRAVILAGPALALVPTWTWAQGPSGTAPYDYGPHMMWWGGGLAVSSLNDVALLLKVFFAVDLSVRVTLFKDLKTSRTPPTTRKRL
jgi:putative membrane protein